MTGVRRRISIFRYSNGKPNPHKGGEPIKSLRKTVTTTNAKKLLIT